MSWESELRISGSVVEDVLIAGMNGAPGAQYGSIAVLADEEQNPGVLVSGSAISGGTVSVAAGGTVTSLTLLGNGVSGGSASVTSGGTVDWLSADGKGARIALMSGAVVSEVHVS